MGRGKVRSSWDEYFSNIAYMVSTRATCPRAAVGAVIVYDKRIVSTGYNGAPSGEPHCTDEGCLMLDNHCMRALHAEANAVYQAAGTGRLVGSTLYLYSLSRPEPCDKCIDVMTDSGIKEVYSATAKTSVPLWYDSRRI